MSEQTDKPSRAPVTIYGTISLDPDASKRSTPETILRMVAEAQAAAWRRDQLEAALLEAVKKGHGVLIRRYIDGTWTVTASNLVPPLTVIAVDEGVDNGTITRSIQEEARIRAKDFEERLKRPRPVGFGDFFEGVFPPPAGPVLKNAPQA